MLNYIIGEIKNIDEKIIKIMFNIARFSMVLAIFSTYILFLYKLNPISKLFFQIGFYLFKCSIMCISINLICGIAFNKLIK